MKKQILRLYLTSCIVIIISIFDMSNEKLNAQCTNADFSLGNFTNWTGQTGSCCPINLPTTGIVAGRHTLMTVPGTDPITGNNLQFICPGYTVSARLGNSGTGAQGEGLRYTYTPTAQSALFEYNYAVVLEDPSHTPSQQPRFEIQVRDQFGNVIPCTLYEVAAGNGIPGFQTFGSVRWKDWTTVGLDLTAYIGTPVTIEARTGDCSLGGHFGYGYLVGDCHPLEIEVKYCVGDTSAVLTAPAGFANYQWSTGQTTQSITIYNPVPGVQNITCTITSVTGCQATLSTIIDPIVIDPGFTMVQACYNTANFTDTSVVYNDNAAIWTWDFGDGNTSTLQNPTHTYSGPGNYNVMLITESDLGCSDTTFMPITITSDPIADFLLPTDCGLTVSFTDQSYIPPGGVGTIVSWEWDFGDGNTSVQQNPSHTYANAGTWNVQLVVTNDAGCTDTVVQSYTNNQYPQAAFNLPHLCGLTGQFSDASIDFFGGTIVNWEWNFDDGNTSILQNPIHTYANEGTYNVQLIVTDDGGCKDTVIVPYTNNQFPNADILLPPLCGLTFQFMDDSSDPNGGAIVNWQWDFGDGNTSNVQNPFNTYPNSGNWNVELIVTDNVGCTDTALVSYTNNEYPQADFSLPQFCGLTGTFNDLSVDFTGGTIVNWEWNFGDGNMSNQQNPLYTYASDGTFNVQLVVTDDGGCTDTIIHVHNNNEYPVADFILPNNCGLDIQFTDNSTDSFGGVIVGWQWDFGDANTSLNQNPLHTYASQNLWNVQLVVTDDGGCTDTVIYPYNSLELPIADFTFNNVCFGLNMPFTDQSSANVAIITSWEWSFGDGNQSIISNPQNNYNSWGNYDVQLVVTTADGCTDTIIEQVMVYPLPEVDFSVQDVCLGSVTTFTNNSSIPTGTINNSAWSFGHSSIPASNIVSPSVVYPNEGLFNVTLVSTSDMGCIDSVSQPVNVWPMPNVNFSASPLAGCYPLTPTFDNLTTISSGSIIYTWDFGDGNSSNQFEPQHTYPNGYNIYNVTLLAVSDHGCDTSITLTNYITVYPNPTAEFMHEPDFLTITDNGMQFLNLSLGATIYAWDFGDGGSSNEFNPYHFFNDTGDYQVTLITTNQYGCTDTVLYTIVVKPEFTIYIPNSFSPNEDGLNDVFYVSGTGLVEADFIVFDRWGEALITLNKDQAFNVGWDGRYQGELVKQDVYVYKITVLDIFGDKHELFGHINLIR